MPKDDDAKTSGGLAPEPKVWQVIFESGQGQQITAASEQAARDEMKKLYGPEYPITSVTDITPQPVK